MKNFSFVCHWRLLLSSIMFAFSDSWEVTSILNFISVIFIFLPFICDTHRPACIKHIKVQMLGTDYCEETRDEKYALISYKDGLALNGYRFITQCKQERSRHYYLSCGFLQQDVSVFLVYAFRKTFISHRSKIKLL